MKKIIFTGIIFWIISVSSISAQVVWGLRAGLSRLEMRADGHTVNGKFGLEIGPMLYYSLKNNFYINSGLMFSMKTFKAEGHIDDWYYSDKLNMTYLDIPLYIGYNIPIGKYSTYAQVGPYIGFNLSAKYKWNDEDSYGSYSYTVDDFANSINAGLGIMYGINISRFKIEAGYQYGFTNIVKNEGTIVDEEDYSVEFGQMKLGSLFLGVSYVF